MGEARHPASSALGRSPRPGTCQVTCASYSSSGWGGTPLGCGRTGATRALLFGSAAGVGFALQATVTKEFMTIVGSGIGVLFSSWEIYVLVATAVVGFALQQSALKTGVLAPAMASSNAVTLFASVIFGITVFEEKLSNGSDRLAPALIGLAVALMGVVLLAGTKPPQSSEPAPFTTQVSRPDPPTPRLTAVAL